MSEILVNVIQNISQNRTDKKITRRDLSYARSVAGLTYYEGTTHYSTKTNDLGPKKSCLEFFMYLVEGTGHNRCRAKWGVAPGWIRDTPDNLARYEEFNSLTSNSVVRYSSSDTESSSVYRSLKIEKGELKIIIDVSLEVASADKSPLQKKFGLYIVSPPKQASSIMYFHTVTIFTPKPGLFSNTAPR